MKADTERFLGAWKLVSAEILSEKGETTHLYGKDPQGYIIYSKDGYMSATITPKNRKRFTTQDILGGTVEEKVAAAESYISYCGRYEVKTDKVIHNIELSFFPNWSGVEQERYYKFEGDSLTLISPPMLIRGKLQTPRLVWERAPKKEA
ncbi:MAG: lipocalin-like domain-containing protein [Candidatus Bathyarchaeota archaeon]|nr:lipocalin-like domain-containing protein [Candidatus Bathyarchaeota archaeon]